MSSFEEIPVLDFGLSRDPAMKAGFLEELKAVLLEVGFLYVKNTGIDDALISEVVRLGKAFFDLPEEEKLRLEMKNSPHFLGYNRLGNEITKYATDWREQVDLATELPAPSPSEPRYRQLRGPNQWPTEESLPGFRKTYTEYMDQMTALSTEFTSLIAQALGLPADSFDKFFHGIGESASGQRRQDKLKIVKYPDLGELGDEGSGGQGVGPHKDSMLSSYLLQASNHRGLQIQNATGKWIDVPPIPGTFVVAMGQGLEAMTSGVVCSTTHRVLSPPAGSGPRFSIPFFQGVSYDATFEPMDVPEDVKALKKGIVEKAAAAEGKNDEVEFTFRPGVFKHLGEATLMNRVKSHPDVGAKYFPDLLLLTKSATTTAAPNTTIIPTITTPTTTTETTDTPEPTKPQGRRRAPTIIVEKIESSMPSYGEDPGPDGSLARKEAWEMRKADAVPDEIRVVSAGGSVE